MYIKDANDKTSAYYFNFKRSDKKVKKKLDIKV